MQAKALPLLKVLSLLVVHLMLVACGESDTAPPIDSTAAPEDPIEPPPGPIEPVQDETNVSYGPSSEQVLDVYVPADRTVRVPTLVLVHGGGWHWGDKQDLDGVAEYFRDLGYAVFNVNYRLGSYPEYVQLDEKLEDIDLALEYVAARAAQIRLSGKIVLMGESSGGHLVLQHAYTRSNGRIHAVVSFYGPTNLTNSAYQENHGLRNALTALLGGPLTSDPESVSLYQEASPLFNVAPTVPPTLLIHGTADTLVPYQDSYDLDQALRAAGATSQLISVEGGDHGISWTNWDAVLAATAEWLEPYSRP